MDNTNENITEDKNINNNNNIRNTRNINIGIFIIWTIFRI